MKEIDDFGVSYPIETKEERKYENGKLIQLVFFLVLNVGAGLYLVDLISIYLSTK